MENNNNVPYIVYESAMARLERIIKRLWITILVLIMLLAASNGAWIWYESQWEDVTTTSYEAEANDGGNAIINRDGEVKINGESKSYENNQP